MTAFTGTLTMVRLILRRDRIRLPVWIVAIVGIVYASAGAVQGLYDTPAKQALYDQTVGSSGATIAMSGPPVALDTVGGITVYEVSISAIIAITLMAIFLVVRHTRGDEEAGRTELLLAGVLGRHAPTAATAIVVGAACVVIGLGITGSFLSFDLAATSSLLFGASITAVGVIFVGFALVAAQVTEHARGATGLGLAALGVAFVLRAIGDVADSWISFLSPIGWTQQVSAFGDERWWPLLLTLGATCALGVLAGCLVRHRDVGAGLVAPRPGPPNASTGLARPSGLAFRLQRAGLLGWLAGMAVLGVAFGSLGQDVQDMLEGNPDLRDAITRAGGASLVDSYYAMILMISALIATGFTLASVLRIRSEEVGGRVESLLATPLSRYAWSLGSLLVTLFGTVLILVTTGVGTGLTHALVTGDSGKGWQLTAGSLAYLPAMLVLGGFAFLLVGWVPRAAVAAWGILAVCVVIGWLGELLSLPDWLMDLSPYTQSPQLPMTDMSWTPVVVMTVVAAAFTLIGALGLRRRDIMTT
ncbi:MAG: ABC transporter permease [Nocardioidaceae bacterium]